MTFITFGTKIKTLNCHYSTQKNKQLETDKNWRGLIM